MKRLLQANEFLLIMADHIQMEQKGYGLSIWVLKQQQLQIYINGPWIVDHCSELLSASTTIYVF